MLKHKTSFGFLAAAMMIAAALLFPHAAMAETPHGMYLSGEPVASYSESAQKMAPEIESPIFACMDEKGDIFCHCEGYSRVKIASVTKVMTALIVSSYPMDTRMVVSEYATSIPGSSAYLQAGDEATYYDMLQGLMLPSGNDAAYALAEDVGGRLLTKDGEEFDPADAPRKVARFVKAMNEKAKELGMHDTVFANPCGLDDDGFEGNHVSSAVDVCRMTVAAMNSPAVREIVAKPYADMLVIREGVETTLPQSNSNRLLGTRDDVIGAKTGFTDAAGGCFTGVARINGKTYYTAVLGAPVGLWEALSDSASLWDWIKTSYKKEFLFSGLPATDEGFSLGKVAAPEWMDKTFSIVVKDDGWRDRWAWQKPDSVDVELDIPKGDIAKDDVVGHVLVKNAAGKIVDRVDVLSAEDMAAPGFWDKLVVSFNRLMCPMTGEDPVALDAIVKPKVVWDEASL